MIRRPRPEKTEPVSAGIAAQLGKYAEALELFWFQYVVGYDQQEQRSLAASVSAHVNQFRGWLERLVAAVQSTASLYGRAFALIGFTIAAVLLFLFVADTSAPLWLALGTQLSEAAGKTETSAVVFYQRLMALLERRGIERNPDLTPLEFANGLGLQPALLITRAYNRVRFGGQELSAVELREIERTLNELEGSTTAERQ